MHGRQQAIPLFIDSARMVLKFDDGPNQSDINQLQILIRPMWVSARRRIMK